MRAYKIGSLRRRRRWPRVVVGLLLLAIVGAAGGYLAFQRWYGSSLRPVNSAAQQEIVVAIPSGATLDTIAALLKDSQLIRDENAFKQYVRARNAGDKLKAGTYKFSQAHSAAFIVDALVAGRVAIDLFTILPGQRLDQIQQAFIDAGFDAAAAERALDPALYREHPALAAKPPAASLEGYLYPESFHKTDDTTPELIITKALDQMAERLTPELADAFQARGLSLHQGITLASIVEREVSSQEDRAKAAQVFLKRLKIDMALGSDVTAPYGAILDGQPPSLTYPSPYNSYTNKGLPPGPISNVTASGLSAVANPAETDFLYFVSGDDGITYFSSTQAEHESLTRQHCRKLCGNE